MTFEGSIFIPLSRPQGEIPPGSENFRRISGWSAVSAEAYFDDFILADEEPAAVSPADKFSTCWGKIKEGYE